MFRRTTAVVVTVALVTLAAAPALAATGPWSDHYGNAGKATVAADRRSITVCDLDNHDTLRFKVDFATDKLVGPTIYTVVAPQGGCSSDRTYVSWIKVFKLCVGHRIISEIGWDSCNLPVYTK
ncbi:hypothetical protein ACGFIV_31310 [Sphaerisporangium sp. NPDC049003]|uniref:hypothetical protein n=1 Tax=Sphaerisporangium sp. NPDC049003 TaxID=3364517 RepID=UPI003724A3A2